MTKSNKQQDLYNIYKYITVCNHHQNASWPIPTCVHHFTYTLLSHQCHNLMQKCLALDIYIEDPSRGTIARPWTRPRTTTTMWIIAYQWFRNVPDISKSFKSKYPNRSSFDFDPLKTVAFEVSTKLHPPWAHGTLAWYPLLHWSYEPSDVMRCQGAT